MSSVNFLCKNPEKKSAAVSASVHIHNARIIDTQHKAIAVFSNLLRLVKLASALILRKNKNKSTAKCYL